MTRHLFKTFALAILALAVSGCAIFKPAQTKVVEPTNNWFLDPAVEMANYKTYGFIQATACRYQDPIDLKLKKKTLWEKMTFKKTKADEKRPEIHYTDELIWRTIEGDMKTKGYAQVAPENADLWVVYYGGPRPTTSMDTLKIQANPFDAYFARNEMTPSTFFVDVIDARTKTLVYRGWDKRTFTTQFPDADKVVDCANGTLSFFPSRR